MRQQLYPDFLDLFDTETPMLGACMEWIGLYRDRLQEFRDLSGGWVLWWYLECAGTNCGNFRQRLTDFRSG